MLSQVAKLRHVIQLAMTYAEWERTVPKEISGDALWQMQAYRLALYAARLGWEDATLLAGNPRTAAMGDQLLRAVNSISANLAEGYSRRFRKEKAHFYDYALGSAREARDWYFKAQPVLPTSASRLETLTRIVKLLTVMVARDRKRSRRALPPDS